MKARTPFDWAVLPCLLLTTQLLTAGCKSSPTMRDVSPSGISETQAIEIAKKQIIEKHHWSSFEVVSVGFLQEGCWAILLQRLPAVPGGHVLIEVSARDGQLIRYYDK